jgi:hypothetical protein
VGGIALALICLALAANLVAWMVAYLAGPGFAVGAGTAFTPFETVGGVEPALPLFGLLPAAEPPGWAGAVVLVPALAGLAAAWWSLRRLGLVWWRQLIGGQLAALMAAAGLGALVALAGGAAGPGRLAEVGAPLWPLAGWLWLELGLGAAAGSVLAARPWRRADALLVGGSAAGEPLAGGGAAAGHSASG